MCTSKIYKSMLVLIVLAFGIITCAHSQEEGIPYYTRVVSLQNSYIGLGITQKEWELLNPTHGLLGAPAPGSGRFQIWSTGGDPTKDNDDGMLWNYSPGPPPVPADKWGAWEIIVDSDVKASTSDTGGTGGTDVTPITSNMINAIWGDTAAGTMTVDPYIPRDENVIRAVWYPSVSSGTGTGTEDTVKTDLRCELEARIMRDTVRFKWTLKNESKETLRIGMKVYADVMPSAEDSGTKDLRNIVSIPGYPLLQNAVTLFDKNIPSVLEMFDNRDDPVHSLRMTFDGQGATKPDVVGVDEWPTIAGDTWNYTHGLTGRPYYDWLYKPADYLDIEDIGYGAIWKPQSLAPGQSRTIINYMGLGCATSDLTKPNMTYPQYVAAVQGPRCLGYYKPAGGTGINPGKLSPAPFTISAYMTNTEKYVNFNNASFTLILPPGLALDSSENGKYSKSVSSIKAGDEGTVSWLVQPVGSPTGLLKYSVSMSADPVGGTVVTRELNIPATETQSLSRGWQMISVPFDLSDTNPDTSLGLSGYTLWKYDANYGTYSMVDQLVPGEAYWLMLQQGQSTAFTSGSNPIAWAGTNGYNINVSKGWNLIGNPYIFSVRMGETKFYSRDYGLMTYDQAISRQLISPTVFWWDTTYNKYNWASSRSAELKPWQGYWFRVLRPGLTMIISPVSQIGARLGGTPEDDGGGGIDPPPAP